jgi:activator of 2-hydroxyglutaryl-CoA dehydratase
MNQEFTGSIGIDAGSTTLRILVLDASGEIIHKIYRRHMANISQTLTEALNSPTQKFPAARFTAAITGSAGMGVAECSEIPFIQEVAASIAVANKKFPTASTLIDLGGEDSKMVFLEAGKQPDVRMNGNCAGGTGAFIDPMTDLMHIPITEMSALTLQAQKTYPVASRCGFFAKKNMQNLIAHNIPPSDVAVSILRAVALQVVSTPAKGRTVRPKIICTGSSLTFIPALRKAFREILGSRSDNLVVPDNSEFFPA